MPEDPDGRPATLGYERPPARSSPAGAGLLNAVAWIVAAGPVSLVWAAVYPAVVGTLPRPTQGEAVGVPWAVCVLGYFAAPWALCLLSFPFIRDRGLRVRLVLWLTLLPGLWYFGAGFDEMLSKAWRRGL